MRHRMIYAGPTPQRLRAKGRSRVSTTASTVALPALVAAVASPVILFYGAGYLLSFGYFLSIGPAFMTAFSPTELALVGFARLSGAIVVCAFLTFLAVTASYIASSRAGISQPRLSKGADLLSGGVCLVAATFIVAASLNAAFLAMLMAIISLVMVGGMGIAFLFGKQDELRRRGNPWRWALPTVLLLIGLPSLGEAGFRAAVDGASAQWIVVGGRPSKLLMLGKEAMIYDAGGCRYLSGPHGESPMLLGRPSCMAKAELERATRSTN